MEINKEEFKKMFPHLAKEIECEKMKTSISSIRSDMEAGERAASGIFEDYNPDIIDFLRRCDNGQQAETVIEYLERKGEISPEYAGRLRKQLKEKGVRSFGSKKEDDYYLRRAEF